MKPARSSVQGQSRSSLLFSILLLLLLHGATAQNADCTDNESCASATAPATTAPTTWCNHGIRKVEVGIDVEESAKSLGWETNVPLYFRRGDDLDAVARSFLETYLLPASNEPVLAKAMREEVAREEPATSRCAQPERFYVEIGTSDFGTLHQQLYAEPEWDGVAVEPLPELLGALPSRPGLFKENAAFGCSSAGVGVGMDKVRGGLGLNVRW